MAVGSQQYAITSTASAIASVPAGPGYPGSVGAVVLLPDATNDVFIGGIGVTSSTGLKIGHGTALAGPIPLYPGDVLYAITASTATVGVLQT